MKKLLTGAIAAVLLLLPLSGVAMAGHEEASQPPALGQEYVPGGVPAQLAASEAMAPALHGVVLAMMNHGTASFNPDDQALAWESLYNMLSLYGQLDDRAENLGLDCLLLPTETVADYCAALDTRLSQLGALPGQLADRLTYEAGSGSYQVACGSNDQASFLIQDSRNVSGGVELSGALVSLVDGSELARFEASLETRDNMFGYAITGLTLK